MYPLKKITILWGIATALLVAIALMFDFPIVLPILTGLIGATCISMFKPSTKVCNKCIGYGQELVGINKEQDTPLYEICNRCVGKGWVR